MTLPLEKLIEQLRKGDVLVVTRLDRLARSTSELLRIAERITEKEAGLQSLDGPWADTTSPSGRMIMTVFASIAEFERTLILSRTQDGRLAAQARGVAFGRQKKCNPISRNSPETGSPSAPSPGPLTSIQPRSIASSTDSTLMLLFCSAQPHRPKVDRVEDALDSQPALTGHYGIAFDAVMLGERNGDISTRVDAAAPITAGFQQRQNIGERIHATSWTIAKIMRILPHRS